ncbi:RICIN domain-containing protein [Actinomadura fibrosa]|uniref:Ricin B lectin domain-containing protein n=1 Tax=Actinomadura fibrosa TaxID=111802 RepID=A0ABW2XFL6_9ACTN|nr:RICIN domain-containing protein [Actinomadura fibrosa]
MRIATAASAVVLASSVAVIGGATSASAQTIGPHKMVQYSSKKCLTSAQNGAITLKKCGSSKSQKWKLTSKKMDHIRTAWLVKNQATGLCLWSDGKGKVRGVKCNSKANTQRWLPTQMTAWMNWTSTRFLDTKNGTPVTQKYDNRKRSQLWNLK